ncbi:glycosyltransferase family 4 protein [Thiomicrorhabdus sediminis]|uniref:Glycosyltransferase family 4 protein n=1 Tax=Thiomicrorhabdus sediminis TaxID=2580412 RepID=A0A4P9K3U7_9GAMM|nr:glycosyltransferase family 4 protein [Thiomicrorhabdus sediminis]QCU89548.1 glycosyltransferase family 4 protein [Thiomicrorhabdus sediminis]
MKIVFLSVFNYGSNIGGIENHIYFISQELQKLGNDITIVQPIDDDFMQKESIVVDGVSVQYVPVKSPRIFKWTNKFNGAKFGGFLSAFLNKAKFVIGRKKIAKEIALLKPDLVHQHDFISNMFTTKYLNNEGVKCILTNHTGEYLFFRKYFIGRWLLKYLLSHFRFIIGPSKELTPNFLVPSKTIHNGADLNFFKSLSLEDKNKIKIAMGISVDDVVISCPRRWAPTKGVVYLVKSIIDNELEFKKRKAVFLFAGSDYEGYPKYLEEIKSHLSKLNDGSLVRLLGNLNIDEMKCLYQVSDIVVIPSLMEAVSLAAVEAMSTGVPVVATDVGGMPELIKDRENGLLVKPENSNELYLAVEELLDNRKLYEAIKKKSLATSKKYDWAYIAKETDKIYKMISELN